MTVGELLQKITEALQEGDIDIEADVFAYEVTHHSRYGNSGIVTKDLELEIDSDTNSVTFTPIS